MAECVPLHSYDITMIPCSFNAGGNEKVLFCFIHNAVVVHVFKNAQTSVCIAGNLE